MAMISMVLSSTSVAVAIPNVMGAFGVGQDKAQWVATAFFASQVATMLLNAWLVSVFGQRTTFIGTLIVAIVACFIAEIGRASCRGRVCQYEEVSVVAGSLKKKKRNRTNNHNE